MNFFKRQHQARRHTALLLGYLLAAVVLIVIAVNAVIYAAAVFSGAIPADIERWIRLPWWPLISIGTLLVIIVGSFVRYLKLKGGGRMVAELMGARKVDMSTRDLNERRFINVVEEMSIASGTPVPDLYVMEEEPGINAFVAGFRPAQAVMVVTRGTLDNLSRDELQGVVAHEFSHIFNGDMRLNVRLMAILAGILTLGVIGRLMMRSTRTRRMTRSRSSGKGEAGAFFIGLGLFLIGYIGLFFGRLIKAAVSRQREFLADASSVQFTRNPNGIAGALWKIREHAGGSLLASAHAEETSHMCFGQSMHFALRNLFATHPPIDERIQRIDPHFGAKRAAAGFKRAAEEKAAPSAAGLAMGFASGAGAVTVPSPADVVKSVGNPQPEHVDYAERLHQSIPASVVDALHDSAAAPWIVYAILLGDVSEERIRVARALVRHETRTGNEDSLETYGSALEGLDVRFRLPLLDLATPALRRLSPGERERFVATCEKLVRIDNRVTLFEMVLLTLLKKHLVPEKNAEVPTKYRSFGPVIPEIRVLLTLVARVGTDDTDQAEKSFARSMQTFSRIDMTPADEKYCRIEALEPILAKLSMLSPLLKESLLVGCADCVIHDGKVTPQEAEILRAIAESLDCPMPPLHLPESSRRAA